MKNPTLFPEGRSDLRPKIIMVGPSLSGKGGISNVVRLWKKGNIFDKFGIVYVKSTSDKKFFGFPDMISGLFLLLRLCATSKAVLYVHTASYRSFYRKCFFLLIGILFRRRIVLHIHPSEFFNFINGIKGVFRKVAFFFLRRVDYLVVLTHEMQSKFESIVRCRKIFVIPNPVDLSEFVNTDGIVRDKRRVLFLGWYMQRKGVFDVVEAAKILHAHEFEVFFDLYGTHGEKELREYVGRAGIECTVKVHGWADHRRKVAALYRSSALVLPSYTEGIPNVILEAMATRTPIVSSIVGGLKEVLADGVNCICVRPGNPLELASKLKQLLGALNVQEELSERAYKDVCEKYSLERVVRSLEYMLNEVLFCSPKT